MQAMLNFSLEEKAKVLAFLEKFPAKETKTRFEEFRCRVGESTVTLYSTGKLVVQGRDSEKAKEKILKGVGLESELILGIDEAGRGEAFGALVVAAVLADSTKMRELRDSKKVKGIEAKRRLVEKNALATAVYVVEACEIDSLRENGTNLNKIQARAINSLVESFSGRKEGFRVLVDGSPLEGARKGIEFIVKGDDKNAVIGAASVLAKSERERHGKGIRKSWKKG
ncbi:MAG: hypothetical protein JW744_05560 [Candidatus Diapherotrites archaeon]|uniref:Ribonuclease n=1 Tax=Candidatus Iainarchaeum sp. TaxID=3101447 RepID=A0A939C6W5_9ARCH|nr:hypothetical protein [Candidatus Diapherotrites archaeon]